MPCAVGWRSKPVDGGESLALLSGPFQKGYSPQFPACAFLHRTDAAAIELFCGTGGFQSGAVSTGIQTPALVSSRYLTNITGMTTGEIVGAAAFALTLVGTIVGTAVEFGKMSDHIDQLEHRVTALEGSVTALQTKQTSAVSPLPPPKAADACFELVQQEASAHDQRTLERIVQQLGRFRCYERMADVAYHRSTVADKEQQNTTAAATTTTTRSH